MKVKQSIVEIMLVLALFSFSWSEETAFGFHLSSTAANTLGYSGYTASFGYSFLKNLELQAGCIVNNSYSSFAREYIGFFGNLPYLGFKATIYESPSRQVSAYIRGEYGKGQSNVKASDTDLIDNYSNLQNLLKTDYSDKSYDLTTEFVKLSFGSEYFLNPDRNFSLSAEFTYCNMINNFKYKGTPLAGVEDVVKVKSNTEGSMGLNFYF